MATKWIETVHGTLVMSIQISTVDVQAYSHIAPSYPSVHMQRPFKIGHTSVHQLYRMQLATKWIETVRRTLVFRFVQQMYGRTVPFLSSLINNVLHHNSLIEQSCKIHCTLVNQLYRMQMETKQIETMHGTLVTSIQISTVYVHAYSHSSQLSHNTYVQTSLKLAVRPYIYCTGCKSQPNGLKQCEEHW